MDTRVLPIAADHASRILFLNEQLGTVPQMRDLREPVLIVPNRADRRAARKRDR